MGKYVIGIDFGSDSARAVVVNAEDGAVLASSVKNYTRWSRGLYCDPGLNQWRQHPKDYLEALEFIIRDSLSKCDPKVASGVVGIGFDTTGSTPCFTDAEGTPLSLLPEFEDNPDAMFILWKDHTSVREAAEINTACSCSDVDYSKYVGGIYDCEWYWAKALHALRHSPQVAARAEAFVECCEWLPAVLTGVRSAGAIVRSRCAKGHKAMWNAEWGGYPPREFFAGIDPLLAKIRDSLPDGTLTADRPVGTLCPQWAEKLGLSTSVVVSEGALDCHVGAVGAGIREKTLVRVIGTSTCDMIVAPYGEVGDKCVPGICGQVDGSIIPGMIGFEAGQSSFGDVYAMFCKLMEWPLRNLSGLEGEALEKACSRILPALTAEAQKLPAGGDGMVSTDWINGRRSPYVNPSVKGTVSGLTLSATAPKLFRSLVEATAFGSKAIADKYVAEGLEIDEVIGIGGIALKNPFVMQTMADVMGKTIKVCNTDQACALGAAMFAATAAGLYSKVEDAVEAMNSGFAGEYLPDAERGAVYAGLYEKYTALGRLTEDALYAE
ncbi:MAG: ribulokinase [Clostridia bacterium]|nr:ribulokinase [Clostridia bacterium]